MSVLNTSLRTKMILLVFFGVVIGLLEYFNVMKYKFEYNRVPVKPTLREMVTVNHSKEDFMRTTNDSSIFIYSAYIEERSNWLRVIGITSRRNTSRVYCILRYKLLEQPLVENGHIIHIPVTHGLRYTATFFLCKLTYSMKPEEVSISILPTTEHITKFLPVKIIVHQHSKSVFSACVPPIHSKFNDTAHITEWIELNKLLGVEKFTFYLNNVSISVLHVLKYYESKDVVTLLPWILPHEISDSADEILHYYGQLAALNDCLYRSKGMSQYISETDLDEIIIPQKPDDITWSDMLSKLPSQSVYIIRSSFFNQTKNCSVMIQCKHKLVIDSFRLRDDFILPSHIRSKYIAKANNVITMGTHFPWLLRTGREYTVSPEVALLHHYRRTSTIYANVTFRKFAHLAAIKYINILKINLKKMKREFSSFSNKTVT